MTYYKQLYVSPLGELSVVTRNQALRGIWFLDQKYAERGMGELLEQSTPVHDQVFAWLDAYFSGDIQPVPVDLLFEGTAFQEQVWQELLAIPPGETLTYQDLAQALDCRSSQAVGQAVGRNPISILVPCHRVLGSDGNLRGYAGGLERKTWLLAHEHSKRKG